MLADRVVNMTRGVIWLTGNEFGMDHTRMVRDLENPESWYTMTQGVVPYVFIQPYIPPP